MDIRGLDFSGCTCRLLSAEEGALEFSHYRPVIIQGEGVQYANKLGKLLRDRSETLRQVVDTFGLVLFRKFGVTSAERMSDALNCWEGFRPTQKIFMVERGRDAHERRADVFTTNTYIKTGGTFSRPQFHSENFYVHEVPRF